jgi:glutamate synthase domain-containing protein 2
MYLNDINAFFAEFPWWGYVLLFLFVVFVRDILQKKHTISHNYPVVGHIRYMLERIGPELRQYIVANNREELPFNRSQRAWVYASSKRQNNYQGFGTDQDIYAAGYIFVNPSLLPFRMPEDHLNRAQVDLIPCAKVMGAYNKRRRPLSSQVHHQYLCDELRFTLCQCHFGLE